MKKLFSQLLLVVAVVFMLSGCATIQKAMEFVNPPYHEIVLDISDERSLVLNAPIDWPAELDTFESMLMPLVFPLADYAIQGDGYIYEIVFNMETLDVYALSKTPGVFYNFDVEKTVWYLYFNGEPIISDVKGLLKYIDEIMNGLREKKTI